MNFPNFDAFNAQFRNGKFNISHKEVVIDDLPFKLLSSSRDNWEDIMNGKPGVVIYSTGKPRKQDAIDRGMDEWLALIWLRKGSTVVPVEVRPTTSARMAWQLGNKQPETEPFMNYPPIKEGADGAEPNTIGDVVVITVTNLPASMSLKGKVDTGATVSSLHADSWKIDGDNVKFVSKQLSPNVITMPLVDQQAVKSADGGTEYRPVIELNIKVGDKTMQKVMFNLNDRGAMEYPVLVGQNVLEKGKFLIDPTINEQEEIIHEDEQADDIDWDQLFENLGPIELPQQEPDAQAIEAVYQALSEADVNFTDLIRFMRTNITENLDDVTY